MTVASFTPVDVAAMLTAPDSSEPPTVAELGLTVIEIVGSVAAWAPAGPADAASTRSTARSPTVTAARRGVRDICGSFRLTLRWPRAALPPNVSVKQDDQRGET